MFLRELPCAAYGTMVQPSLPFPATEVVCFTFKASNLQIKYEAVAIGISSLNLFLFQVEILCNEASSLVLIKLNSFKR